VLNQELWKVLFHAEPLRVFILYMLGGGLGDAPSPNSSSVLGTHLPWLQELPKRFLGLLSPFSVAEGPGAE